MIESARIDLDSPLLYHAPPSDRAFDIKDNRYAL